MDNSDYAIVVEDLTRTFSSHHNGNTIKVAVDKISFNVKRGEIYGILGPNGAGKTTTIKMLSTLLIPTSGKATILGLDVTDEKNVRTLRNRINVVSGGERGLYYRLSGRQNLEFFADLYNIPKKKQKKLIDDLLELVELTDAADIKTENYSRGMKQRIHIAHALINDPEILYLDEPTIGLDPEISKEIRSLIRKLSDGGKTIILTTHYMFEAEELCNHMIIMSSGKIVGKGNVTDIKNSISNSSSIRVVTEREPVFAIESMRTQMNVDSKVTKLLNGRFVTKFTIPIEYNDLSVYENIFRHYTIKNIGIEEITLEDAYLALVGDGEE